MKLLTRQAIDIFRHAVAAVQPQQFMRVCLEVVPPDVHVLVIGAGKASGAMAMEAEILLGDRIVDGLVITNRQADQEDLLPLKKIKQVFASHPVPDADSLEATDALLDLIMRYSMPGVAASETEHTQSVHPNGIPRHKDTFILFLLSGGASSLMADVPPGSSLAELQQLFNSLLKSGADIREMNTVRKHLSKVKGGQLARHAYPSPICTIILSDVTGNDPAVIGSGPTVPDPSTFTAAWEILEKYKLTDALPQGIHTHLQGGLKGAIPETPKPGDTAFAHARYIIAASNLVALEAAQQKAEELGYHTQILTDKATGEANILGATLARQAMAYKGPYPACLLAGGESTVIVRGTGLGGRNQELALAAGITLKDAPHITFLSAGTDGIDGPTDAAGAVVNAQIMQNGPEATPYLQNNDAYHFFGQTGSLIKTGHTHTNVMDVIVILITDPALPVRE